MSALFRFAPFGTLLLLLPLELFLDYDTMTRKLALMLTNISVLIAVAIFLRSHSARNNPALAVSVGWLASIGVWCDAIGNFLHFYSRFTWWDQLSHGVGTATLALGVLLLVLHAESSNAIRLGPILRIVFSVAVAVTFSALYEISEYIGDQLFPTHRITDLYDTADDLLWNFLTAVIVTVLVARFNKRV